MKTIKYPIPVEVKNMVEHKAQLRKRATIEKIKKIAKTRSLNGLSWKLLRDEGRR